MYQTNFKTLNKNMRICTFDIDFLAAILGPASSRQKYIQKQHMHMKMVLPIINNVIHRPSHVYDWIKECSVLNTMSTFNKPFHIDKAQAMTRVIGYISKDREMVTAGDVFI